MKIKALMLLAAFSLSGLAMTAQEQALPTPEQKAGLTIMESFAQRKSIRDFSDKELSEQELSNLLWAAKGQNRADGKLTAPSCLNFQEIRLFVFDKNGVAEYLPATHSLKSVATGDYRNLVAGGQEFASKAPICLVMIADMTKFNERLGGINERTKMMAAVDAGIVSENISLACAGLGLATVPRASMEADKIISLLNLPDNHIAIMNNPVGFEAKQ